MSKLAAISFSGGMDSTSLLLHLINNNYTVYALSFNYGQKHIIEIDRARQNIQYLKSKKIKVFHKVVNISDCVDLLASSLTTKSIEIPNGHYEEDSMKSTFVPNRNSIFTSILYGYGITISKNNNNSEVLISLGVHSGDHTIYPDCRKEFYINLFNAFKEGNWDSDKIKIYLPYLNMDKTKILSDAKKSIKKNNLDFNTIFKNTITSYEPDSEGRSSGKTGSDIERILAFYNNGLKDPIDYVDDWDTVLNNARTTELNFNKTI